MSERLFVYVRPFFSSSLLDGSAADVASALASAPVPSASKILVVHAEENAITLTNAKDDASDGSSTARKYIFSDGVFDISASQEDVYKGIMLNTSAGVVLGGGEHRACVIAYGSASSGKTYCLMGATTNRTTSSPASSSVLQASDGIVPRLLKDIFETQKVEGSLLGVEIAYLQLYYVELRDLLAPTASPTNSTTSTASSRATDISVQLREDKEKGVWVQGAVWRRCETIEAALNLVFDATRVRDAKSHSIVLLRTPSREISTGAKLTTTTTVAAATSSTSSLSMSSKASSLLGISTTAESEKSTDGNMLLNTSASMRPAAFCLVDLGSTDRDGVGGAAAGGLTMSTSDGKLDHHKQRAINSSLCALGIVISALSLKARGGRGRDGKAPFVPFRNSTLTRILQPYLSSGEGGGSNRTIILATIKTYGPVLASSSPPIRTVSVDSAALATLDFASRAASIRLEQSVGRHVGVKASSSFQLRVIIQEKDAIIDRLRTELSLAHGGGAQRSLFVMAPSSVTATEASTRDTHVGRSTREGGASYEGDTSSLDEDGDEEEGDGEEVEEERGLTSSVSRRHRQVETDIIISSLRSKNDALSAEILELKRHSLAQMASSSLSSSTLQASSTSASSHTLTSLPGTAALESNLPTTPQEWQAYVGMVRQSYEAARDRERKLTDSREEEQRDELLTVLQQYREARTALRIARRDAAERMAEALEALEDAHAREERKGEEIKSLEEEVERLRLLGVKKDSAIALLERRHAEEEEERKVEKAAKIAELAKRIEKLEGNTKTRDSFASEAHAAVNTSMPSHVSFSPSSSHASAGLSLSSSASSSSAAPEAEADDLQSLISSLLPPSKVGKTQQSARQATPSNKPKAAIAAGKAGLTAVSSTDFMRALQKRNF